MPVPIFTTFRPDKITFGGRKYYAIEDPTEFKYDPQQQCFRLYTNDSNGVGKSIFYVHLVQTVQRTNDDKYFLIKQQWGMDVEMEFFYTEGARFYKTLKTLGCEIVTVGGKSQDPRNFGCCPD